MGYEKQMFNIVSYEYDDRRVINPFNFTATTEFGNTEFDDFVKVFAEGNFTVTYPRKKTGLGIRVFGGVALNEPTSSVYKFRLSATTGMDDYRFDDVFFGRSEEQGLLAHQVTIGDDGGFKMKTNGVFPRIGETPNWILSVNLKIPMPFFTPVFAFADAGITSIDESSTLIIYDAFQYDAGVGFTLVPKIVDVYLPLFFSGDIRNNLLTTDFYEHWYQRITFTFNIDRLNPFAVIRNFEL
jgi:hypothetical protein